MRLPLTPFIARWGVTLAGLAAALGIILLYHAAPHLYLLYTALPDEIQRPVPFVDLSAILQADVCWRAGVDVYTPSHCMGGGVFNYSPVMLRSAYLPLNPSQTPAGGLLMCLAFFASLALLPPARSWAELALRCAAALCPTTSFALEQGNFDAAIFAAVLAALWLLRGSWRARLAAYGLFLLAAALKFYPIALLTLAVREPRRQFFTIAGISVLILAVLLCLYGQDSARAAAILPGGMPFHATFGAVDFPRGLNHRHDLTPWFVNHLLRLIGLPWRFTTNAGLVNATMYLMDLAALVLMARNWRPCGAHLARLTEAERLYFLAGAGLILFCFFAAQNVSYRAVFLIPLLPALWHMGQCAPAARLPRRLTRVILLLLWEAVCRTLIGTLEQAHLLPGKINFVYVFWLLRETLWWWLIIMLGRFCLAYGISAFARLLPAQIDGRRQKS